VDVRHQGARAAWQLPRGGACGGHRGEQGDAVGAARHHPVQAAAALTAVALAALAAAAPAPAATSRVNCSKKDVTVLFWPHGHQAIPSLGFPEFLLPHLEVYKTASSYPTANELAVVQADGGTGVSPSCAPAGERKARRFDGKPRRTANATALRCRSKKASRLELVGDPGKSGTLRVWYGRKLGAVAELVASGSTLSFDRGYCKPVAL
jgi:hypothetical protein